MIQGEVHSDGEIEVEDNLSDVMADIAALMHESIIAGLEGGGFAPLAGGGESDLGGRQGSIARSMGHESTGNTATAGVFDLLPYSYIHNFGGLIPVTERSRSFFWYMHKETGDEMWKAMALKYQPGDSITMPQREYINFTEPLIADIMDRLKKQLLTFKKGGRVVN